MMKIQLRKYLSLFLLLLPFADCAASDFVLFRGAGQPGFYVPGSRTDAKNWYPTSSQNVAVLKELQQNYSPIRIAGFSATIPGETTRICRLSYPLHFPNKLIHEAVIAEAMRAELLEANLYSESAPIAITGQLLTMDFNSFGTGNWAFEAKFGVEGKEPITVKHIHTYSISFGAVNACRDVGRALVPALQGFLMAVYSDAGFKALIKPIAILDAIPADRQNELKPSDAVDVVR